MADGKKTGGREKGTPNKRTFDARALAEKKGVDPLEILLDIAGNNWPELGYETCFITKVNMGIEYEESVITMENRLNAAKEAAKYIYPQLKSTEITGKDGASLFVARMVAAQARVRSTLVGDAVDNDPEPEDPIDYEVDDRASKDEND